MNGEADPEQADEEKRAPLNTDEQKANDTPRTVTEVESKEEKI